MRNWPGFAVSSLSENVIILVFSIIVLFFTIKFQFQVCNFSEASQKQRLVLTVAFLPLGSEWVYQKRKKQVSFSCMRAFNILSYNQCNCLLRPIQGIMRNEPKSVINNKGRPPKQVQALKFKSLTFSHYAQHI